MEKSISWYFSYLWKGFEVVRYRKHYFLSLCFAAINCSPLYHFLGWWQTQISLRGPFTVFFHHSCNVQFEMNVKAMSLLSLCYGFSSKNFCITFKVNSPNHSWQEQCGLGLVIFVKKLLVGTYCIEQGTLFNVMWQPRWEWDLGENGCMHVYGWVPLLCIWYCHNIVNWLYANTCGFPGGSDGKESTCNAEDLG